MEWFLNDMNWTACHPSFRLDWFQKIDMLMYKEARNVVKRKYDEYRQKRLQPQTAPSTPTKAGASKQSQLSLALGSPIKLPVPADTRPSGDLEWHRWCSGEGGGNLERPLLWWKVGSPFICFDNENFDANLFIPS